MSSMDPTVPGANPRREKQSSELRQNERDKKDTEQEHRGTWGAKTEVLLRDQRKRGSGGRRGFRGGRGSRSAEATGSAPPAVRNSLPTIPNRRPGGGGGTVSPPTPPAPVPHFRMWPTPRTRLARLPPPARTLTIRLSLISPSSLSTLREPAQLRPPSSPR